MATDDLVRDLRKAVDGEVRVDAGSLAAYAHDASNYRQPPIAVVVPRSVDAGAAAVRVCRDHGAPVLSRGGGTSLAGQCCNTAVVIDWSKYCRRVVSVDPAERVAVVEPGISLDDLNAELEPYGLMVGPRPSTHDTCTIGGMIGNNSCGASAQAYGKMADSVRRLEVLTYDGARFWAGPMDDEEYERLEEEADSTRASGVSRQAEIYRMLRRLRDENLAVIRTRFPDLPRRVSGYNLDALLPENGFDVAKALVGSESTLVTVLRAEIGLVPVPAYQSLVVLGFDDIAQAGDAVPGVAVHDPLALEGLDQMLVELARAEHLMGEDVAGELPEGRAWLMVRFGGDDREEADARAQRLLDALGLSPDSPRVGFLDDPGEEERLWKVREAGLGATAYPPGRPDTHEGWEDSAVPPQRLGEYLRAFRALIDQFGYGPVSLYGHFGHGCVHTRIPFSLAEDKGVERYREFIEQAARMVTGLGGSLSGEHGDGQSRAELLPIMFGPEVVRLFERMKAIFDPAGLMNPGKVVRPYPPDSNLDLRGYHPDEPQTYFAYPDDGGRFAHAAARCVGIGKCRTSGGGGVMCPSYRATREERHTTRGRARILQEMMRGDTIKDGWHSTDVHDALDLCLACKGCRQDCPVSVDMATYKAEFLAHHYKRRLRPPSHYSMGWLPVWATLASAVPHLVNTAAQTPPLSSLIKLAGGVDRRRSIPRFARQRFTDWFRDHEPPGPLSLRGRVVLWPDTFTNNFHPHIAQAAVEVLERAGFQVDVPPTRSLSSAVCCGLTWISTGQLDTARRVLRRTARVLAPRLRQRLPVVVLEPSCAAVFRADAPELLAGNEDIELLRAQTRTLAELLDEHDVDFTPTKDVHAIAQPHCHHHSIMGFDADGKVLKRAGVDLQVLDEGCCGLAGNFGFERGHYDVSAAIAETGVWPALRNTPPDTTVLADGFSCRTQIETGTGRTPRHLAELLRELG